MRAFSVLTVILGMSVYALAACSSDSDGNPGTGGDTSEAGASGKAGSNSSGAAGETTGAAGAPGCAFESTACSSCLVKKCTPQVGACSNATDCSGALSDLDGCACDPDKTALMCETAFLADGGDQAQPLVDCFNDNCASVCSQ